MNQELPPGQDAEEIQELAQVVADSLAKGEDPRALAQQLIDSGWEPDQANALVGSIHQQMIEHSSQDGGGSESRGWLVWLGAILGINFLSWVFDWGFWIY